MPVWEEIQKTAAAEGNPEIVLLPPGIQKIYLPGQTETANRDYEFQPSVHQEALLSSVVPAQQRLKPVSTSVWYVVEYSL